MSRNHRVGNDALATDIDVLGVASALVGHQIRTDIQAELGRVRASSGKFGVDIRGLALAAGLHRALTVGIVPVVCHETVVIGSNETVFLVPLQFALTDAVVPMPVVHHTACVDEQSIFLCP